MLNITKRQYLALLFGDEKVLIYESAKDKIIYLDNIQYSEPNATNKFKNILKSHSKASLVLAIYSQHESIELLSYPDIGALNIFKKIKKLVGARFTQNEIKDALLVCRPTIDDDNWKYCFTRVHLTHQMQEFINIALNTKNYIKGVYLYSFEIIKAAIFLNNFIPTDSQKEINIFYFRSHLGFIKKIVIQNQKLADIRSFKSKNTDNIKTFLDSEKKLYEQYKYSNKEINRFFVNSCRLERITHFNHKRVLKNISWDTEVVQISPEKFFFDDIFLLMLKSSYSKPVKLKELKRLNALNVFCEYAYRLLFILLIIIMIIYGQIYYKGRGINQNLQQAKQKLFYVQASSKGLNDNLDKSLRQLNSQPYLRNIYTITQNYDSPFDILQLLHDIETKGILLKSFKYNSMHNNETVLKIGFDNFDTSLDLPEAINNYLSLLSQKLPDKNITFVRENIVDSKKNNNFTVTIKITNR